MSDLIKRQEAIEAVEEGMCTFYDCYVIEKLKEVSPRTTVSVVRCGECKFCAHYTDGRIECRLWEHPLRIQYSEMKLDDFCSYGERSGSE